MGQQGAGFVTRYRPAEHAHKGVLSQVGGIPGVAQASLQPAVQPPVMVAVKSGEGLGADIGFG